MLSYGSAAKEIKNVLIENCQPNRIKLELLSWQLTTKWIINQGSEGWGAVGWFIQYPTQKHCCLQSAKPQYVTAIFMLLRFLVP